MSFINCGESLCTSSRASERERGEWCAREQPQSLFDLCRWKATELRFFLLYAGPIVLNMNIIPKEYITHFNALSCSIRILCHVTDWKENNDFAHELLVYFVKQLKHLHGEEFITSNVNALIHLARDVKLYGPLDSFSAFDFENYMQFLKKILRKCAKSLQQIHRHLKEKLHPTEKRKQNVQYPLFLQLTNETLPFGCTNSHRKFQNFELSCSKHENCCILNDKAVVLIKYIGKLKGDLIIIGQKLKKRKVLEP